MYKKILRQLDHLLVNIVYMHLSSPTAIYCIVVVVGMEQSSVNVCQVVLKSKRNQNQMFFRGNSAEIDLKFALNTSDFNVYYRKISLLC